MRARAGAPLRTSAAAALGRSAQWEFSARVLEVDQLDVTRREGLAEEPAAHTSEAFGAVSREETHAGFAALIRTQSGAQSLTHRLGRRRCRIHHSNRRPHRRANRA